jgi:hypothetical protein
MPGVVIVAEQLTEGGFGMSNAWKSMCWASLQTLTGTLWLLHAYCAGVAPFGSGPKTSGGRRQIPPESHVHGEKPAARCGQSDAELQTVVQPPTTICGETSHAAGAMHAAALLASHGASAFTQIDWFDTIMQP